MFRALLHSLKIFLHFKYLFSNLVAMGRKFSVYKCSTNYLSSKENTHEKTIGTIGTILKKKYQKGKPLFFSQ